jgi:hypothetical protein
MANPFREVIDGQASPVQARPLALLLSVPGSLVAVADTPAAQDAQRAAHAVPLFTDYLAPDLPVQLAWNHLSTALVLTTGVPGDQVRYSISQSTLLEALRYEQRWTQARQASLEVTISVRAEQVPEFRELVQQLYDESYGEEDEPLSARTAAFYEEHPDLAPEPGSQLGIRSESVNEHVTVFTLWVSDAQIANSLGHIWEQREQAWQQAQPAGSPTALQQELAEVLRASEGYGWSLARLLVYGENPRGKAVEAEEAEELFHYLQLQLKALEARRVYVSALLEQEGGPDND